MEAAYRYSRRVEDLDGVIEALVEDLHPTLSRSEASPFPAGSPELSIRLYQHPLSGEFERLVLADQSLPRLFTGADENAHFVLRSTGQGSGLQLELFSSLLLQSAWRSAARDVASPSVEDVHREATRQLQLIRDGLSSDGGQTRAFVGLAGLRLPDGADFDMGWGRLRSTRAQEYQRAGALIPGRLTTTTPEGDTVEIAYSGDIVLEVNVPYLVTIATSRDLDAPTPLPRDALDRLTGAVESVRLAALLALDISDNAGLVNTWHETEDPLSWESRAWRDPSRLSLVPRQLTSREAREWTRWSSVVDAERVPSIDVAVRRTLLATERGDPVDGLVDAVMAWENLFGSRTEVTHRVSASMAWLIGCDQSERENIYRSASRIYNLRSRIVHGSHVAPEVAQREKSDALALSRRALRALFLRRYLLRDFRTSDDRSARLLLSGEPAGPDRLPPEG